MSSRGRGPPWHKKPHYSRRGRGRGQFRKSHYGEIGNSSNQPSYEHQRDEGPRNCQLLDADIAILSSIGYRVGKFRRDECRRNVKIYNDRTVARSFQSFKRGGAAFLDEFLTVHEFVAIEMNKISRNIEGGYSLGVTTRRISSLCDSKTKELWHSPPDTYLFDNDDFNASGTIVIWLLCTGELQATMNDYDKPEILCTLDLTKNYTLFINMFGAIFEIRAFIYDDIIGMNDCRSEEKFFNEEENAVVRKYGVKQQPVPNDDKPENFCVICLEEERNTAVYECGHKCLCYECGLSLLERGDERCPICRAEIRDVIRIYEV